MVCSGFRKRGRRARRPPESLHSARSALLLVRSCSRGSQALCVPDDLEILFDPVTTTSPAERAELVQKLSSDVIEAFKCGLLTREQALEELKARGEELGVYTKV